MVITALSRVRTLRCYVIFCLIVLFCPITVIAQGSSTDGSTPLASQPGAPAGSYALSNLEHVNIYNGHLSVNVPVVQIGGRGGAQVTLAAMIDPSPWRILTKADQLGTRMSTLTSRPAKIYPKVPGGGRGDSIGNIWDYIKP